MNAAAIAFICCGGVLVAFSIVLVVAMFASIPDTPEDDDMFRPPQPRQQERTALATPPGQRRPEHPVLPDVFAGECRTVDAAARAAQSYVDGVSLREARARLDEIRSIERAERPFSPKWDLAHTAAVELSAAIDDKCRKMAEE